MNFHCCAAVAAGARVRSLLSAVCSDFNVINRLNFWKILVKIEKCCQLFYFARREKKIAWKWLKSNDCHEIKILKNWTSKNCASWGEKNRGKLREREFRYRTYQIEFRFEIDVVAVALFHVDIVGVFVCLCMFIIRYSHTEDEKKNTTESLV